MLYRIRAQRYVAMAIVATLFLLLASCAQDGKKERSGRVVGGILGAVAGAALGGSDHRAVGAVLGAVAGSMIGGSVGKSMDAKDRQKAERALEHNQTGQASAWKNPDTGNSFRVTPVRTYQSAGTGLSCREYKTEAIVDGRREVIHGRACRTASGGWKEDKG